MKEQIRLVTGSLILAFRCADPSHLISQPANASEHLLHRMTLQQCGDHYCLEAYTRGSLKLRLRLALDLASERSYLKASSIEKANVATEPMLFIRGKAVPGYRRTKPIPLNVGGLDFGLRSFDVVDSRELPAASGIAGRNLSPDEDGGIAADMFDNRLIKFDDSVFSRALYLSTGLNPQIYATNTTVHGQRSTYKNIFPLRLYGTTTLSCGNDQLSNHVPLWFPAEGAASSRTPYGATLGLDVFRLATFLFDFQSNRILCRP